MLKERAAQGALCSRSVALKEHYIQGVLRLRQKIQISNFNSSIPQFLNSFYLTSLSAFDKQLHQFKPIFYKYATLFRVRFVKRPTLRKTFF